MLDHFNKINEVVLEVCCLIINTSRESLLMTYFKYNQTTNNQQLIYTIHLIIKVLINYNTTHQQRSDHNLIQFIKQ